MVDVGRLVGLAPAAGRAARLGRLPCSKEVYPLGVRETAVGQRVRVACESLFDAFDAAGVARVYVVVGHGKWDVPAFLGQRSPAGTPLTYIVIENSPSTCHTVDAASPFVDDALVAFGFPDILIEPRDCVARLRDHQRLTGADLVLGLFRAERPSKMDMVELDASGTVQRIVIKPSTTTLEDTWILAVWTPRFTSFLHDYVRAEQRDQDRERYVGDAMQAAIDAGWRIEGVRIPGGRYRDIGTPDDLPSPWLTVPGEDATPREP